MLLNNELNWLVGFIEGEGCFCMALKKKTSKRPNHRIHCSFNVTNTDIILINKSKSIIDKIIGKNTSIIRTTNIDGYKKNIYRLWIENMPSLKLFIETILPLLSGTKTLQASIMLQFIERRLKIKAEVLPHQSIPYTEEDWKYYEAMKAFKGTMESVETIRFLSQVDKDIVRTATIDKIAELGRNALTLN